MNYEWLGTYLWVHGALYGEYAVNEDGSAKYRVGDGDWIDTPDREQAEQALLAASYWVRR